jgi:hypothetical protein
MQDAGCPLFLPFDGKQHATMPSRHAELRRSSLSSSAPTGSSNAMCHPSQCTAWRQGQGLVKAPSPQTLPCAQFRALAQRARTPSTSRNTPNVGAVPRGLGKPLENLQPCGRYQWKVFVSYLCSVTSRVLFRLVYALMLRCSMSNAPHAFACLLPSKAKSSISGSLGYIPPRPQLRPHCLHQPSR